MFTAVGYSVLIRGFRLALSVEGLKPRTIENYVSDTERFAAPGPPDEVVIMEPAVGAGRHVARTQRNQLLTLCD